MRVGARDTVAHVEAPNTRGSKSNWPVQQPSQETPARAPGLVGHDARADGKRIDRRTNQPDAPGSGEKTFYELFGFPS